ncbi:MAG: hypothetical protein RR726_16045, partial [Pseudomonas sp.]
DDFWTVLVTAHDVAERSALAKGWQLERNLAGHRIADFPHALFGQDKLADLDIVPSEMVWVLEIQLCHPTEPVGAFFEDILVGQASPAPYPYPENKANS